MAVVMMTLTQVVQLILSPELANLILRGLFVWLLVSVLAGLLWVFVMTRRPR